MFEIFVASSTWSIFLKRSCFSYTRSIPWCLFLATIQGGVFENDSVIVEFVS